MDLYFEYSVRANLHSRLLLSGSGYDELLCKNFGFIQKHLAEQHSAFESFYEEAKKHLCNLISSHNSKHFNEESPCGSFTSEICLTWCIISVTLLKKEKIMPTKNPRVNIVVEPPLYSAMHDLAASTGVSMSTLARDLIREAISRREDVALGTFADARMKTFDRKAALSHEDTWE